MPTLSSISSARAAATACDHTCTPHDRNTDRDGHSNNFTYAGRTAESDVMQRSQVIGERPRSIRRAKDRDEEKLRLFSWSWLWSAAWCLDVPGLSPGTATSQLPPPAGTLVTGRKLLVTSTPTARPVPLPASDYSAT